MANIIGSVSSAVSSATSAAGSVSSVVGGLTSSVGSIGSLLASNNSAEKGQLIPQTERLFTALPRQSLAGQEQDFCSLYVKNYKASKSTQYASLKGLQTAVTNTKVGFASFLLQNWEFNQVERTQLTPVFGGGIVAYFFGQDPITLTITGNIPDDVDNQWFLQFAAAYQEFLRGTQLARRYEEMVFLMPNMTIGGAIMDLSYAQDASRWVDIPFTATILVRTLKFRPVILGGSINAPQQFANSAAPKPTYSFSAINNTKVAVGGLGIGSAVPTETVASLQNGAITPGDSAAALLGGAATPTNTTANLLAGAATPTNSLASLSMASSLMNLQQGLIPGTNGSAGGSGAWMTNAFSSVSGFLKTLSGYINDVQSYIESAIQDTGIGSFISLLDQAGGDINSVISTVSGLVGTVENDVASVIGTVASIPGEIIDAFSAPLANLLTLKGNFTNFVDQMLALPGTVSATEQEAVQQLIAATVPLASAPLFTPGSGTNGLTLSGSSVASLGGGGSGSNSSAGLGVGGSGPNSSAGLGAGSSGTNTNVSASLGSGATTSSDQALVTGAQTPPNSPALL